MKISEFQIFALVSLHFLTISSMLTRLSVSMQSILSIATVKVSMQQLVRRRRWRQRQRRRLGRPRRRRRPRRDDDASAVVR